MTRWKIDEATDLPLAIIEDTEEGMEVVEIGEYTEANIMLATTIVNAHNKEVGE